MAILIRMELYKIIHQKWMMLLFVSCLFVYIFFTYTYYYWHDSIAWEQMTLFPFSFGAIIQGLMLLVALPPSFTQEYQRNLDSLLFSSKHGRHHVIWAKIVSATLFSTFIVTGCWSINVLVNIGFINWGGWDLPIQALSRYESSPYTLSIWKYSMVQFLTNWLGCIVFGFFILFVSARCRSYLTVFFIAGIVFIIPFFIRNTSDLSIPWLMKNVSMIEIMRVENLFNRQRFVQVGTWMLKLPVIYFYIQMILLSALFISGTFQIIRKREV